MAPTLISFTTVLLKANMSNLKTYSYIPSVTLFLLVSIWLANGEQGVTCPPLQDLNYKPVIGILNHPRKCNGSYLPASYVKFIESAGARVIPLIYDDPWTVTSAKLDLVNGVLITTGARHYKDYVSVVRKIFQKVIEKNDAGEYFPCYAMNLGFELLSTFVSGSNDIVESYDATKLESSLKFVDGVKSANLPGTVFGSFPSYLRYKLESDCIVSVDHKNGISKESFDNDKQLSTFFKVLTTGKDRNQKEYVSTVQALKYPITAFQWDPEKSAYEWLKAGVPHTQYAIEVTQKVANYFVSEARKSRVEPPLEQLLEKFIYNYPVTYTGADAKGFDEIYYFDLYVPDSVGHKESK